MNAILILAILGAGPFGAAIKQAAPVVDESQPQWEEVAVGDTTISLPVPEAIETAEYQRTAPDNYKIPTIHWSKSVPVWCPVPGPRHGYNCGMHKTVEDLAGHLQTAHGVPLETLTEMGRENWQSYHEDLEWCNETPERQEQFLNPTKAVAKPAVKSGCGPNGCPKPQSGGLPRSYGLFRRWR